MATGGRKIGIARFRSLKKGRKFAIARIRSLGAMGEGAGENSKHQARNIQRTSKRQHPRCDVEATVIPGVSTYFRIIPDLEGKKESRTPSALPGTEMRKWRFLA